MAEDYKPIAKAIINRHTSKIPMTNIGINVNTETLGADLSVQLLSYLLAVCQVFDELVYIDKTWTGFYMIKNTSDAILLRVAGSKQGNALLNSIHQWVGQNKLTQGGKWVNEFNTVQERIYTARRQAGTLINYNPHGLRELQDYEIPAGGNKDIRFELPEEGANYFVYNRNDVQRDGLDQIGTKETIEAIWNIAATWKSKGTSAHLEIGDISRAGGLDTSEHETHEDGKAFDMRPMRNDGGRGTPFALNADSYHQIYHRDWTKGFIRMVRQLYPGTFFYFNDKYIYEDAEFSGFVKFMAAHFDHLHVILPGGERLVKKEGVKK